MLKQMRFVRRAAGIDAAGFAAAWRSLARAQWRDAPPGARPRRLEHCVVREGRAPAPWHGVALAWFDDEAARRDYADSLRAGEMAGRSAEVLDAATAASVLVEERCVFGADWLAARRAAEASTPLLLGCIARAPRLDRTGFRDYWWDRHRVLANALVPPPLQPPAYVHDYVLPAEDCAWDGFGELYESDMDHARRRGQWFESAAAAPLLADEDRFMLRGTRQILVTLHEAVI